MPQNDVLICAVTVVLGAAAAVLRSGLVVTSFAISVLYLVSLVTYRLLLHPIAGFPGPRLAAATYLYEFYYDLIKAPGGQYVFQLEDLHVKYGPILRITPDEIQVSDAEFFEKVYVSGAEKRHRWERAGTKRTSPGSMSAAYSHDLHRLRRNSVQNYFSKAAVARAENRLLDIMRGLAKTLEKAAESREVLNISLTMSRVTLSFITEYVFGNAWVTDIDQYIDAMRTGFESLTFFKFFPVLQSIPRSLVERMAPVAKVMTLWENRVFESVSRVKEMHSTGIEPEALTVFNEVLDSKLPDSEKETLRVRDEAIILTIAGSETTARTLSYAVYWLLANSDVLAKLQAELDEAFPGGINEISLAKVEQLPFLVAVIKETHRTIAGTMARSLLISDAPTQYQEWTIPPGTPMCVNFRAVLHNKIAFPNPKAWDPSRWLSSNEDELYLRNKYFTPFGKGHRNCVGQNLAWAELYLGAAIVFRGFELELHDVEYARDLEVKRDCFIGLPSPESRGVRVKVLSVRT